MKKEIYMHSFVWLP